MDRSRLAGVAEGIPLVWQAPLTDDRAVHAHLTSVLSGTERERMEQFRRSGDQARFLVGRGLLRLLVGAQVNLPPERVAFKLGPFGKPFMVPPFGKPPLHFNVAHSGQWVLLAFSATHEVGVDIEEIRPAQDWQEVGRRIFPAAEYAAWLRLEGAERSPAFFQIWTRHEAGLKALGLGLAGADEGKAIPNDRLTIFDLDLPAGYRGAVAWVG